MEASATTFPSILDKPLKKLTEDDISQLTREDCRKFLKQKGMRRPSWNKSQAIQQVVSLKALLERSDDDDSSAGTVRKFALASTPENTPIGDSNVFGSDKVTEGDAQVPAEETALPAREELQGAGSSAETLAGAGNNEKAVNPRQVKETTNYKWRQTGVYHVDNLDSLMLKMIWMIKVNVYDGVPPDKAHAIMQLAASPFHFLQEGPFNRSKSVWPFPCHSQKDKDAFAPIDTTISQVAQADKMVEYPVSLWHRGKGGTAHDTDREDQASRKVLLQKYLEKRKDRGRLQSQKIAGITSSSSLEMYLNYQVKAQASIGNSSYSSPSSPTQPRLPDASGSFIDNQLKIALPVDLNDRDVEDCL